MGRITSLKTAAFAAALVAAGAATFAFAQSAHKVVTGDNLKWSAGPPELPKGAQVAILSGDPGKPGLFVLRAKMPDGYLVPPHWHSQTEFLTVLSGRLHVGMGDEVNRASAQALGPGAFISLPGKMRHYVWTSGETVIQVTSTGPFDITYVNAKDDPRQATTGAR